MREGSAQGFRNVAGYIFGKNRPRGLRARGAAVKMAMTSPVRVSQRASEMDSVKMAMTAPVRMNADGSEVKVSFVVPSEYSRWTAPMPQEKSVRLRDVRSHVLAVKAFSGPPPNERRVERERGKVVEAVEGAGIKVAVGAEGEETLVYGARPSCPPQRRASLSVLEQPPAALSRSSPGTSAAGLLANGSLDASHAALSVRPAGYHDPFITPNFLRRNEVAVRLQDSSSLA